MIRTLLLLVASLTSFAMAQQPPLNSPLLEHLTGKWVLDGIIAGDHVTHDVDGEWVLDHHYVRLHEVSREKTDKGKPRYEALVFVGWNEEQKQFACAWLDIFGGLLPVSIGIATPKENEIPFVFKDDKGTTSITNDFVYDPKQDTWQWRIDNINNGTAKPFARVTLSRAGH